MYKTKIFYLWFYYAESKISVSHMHLFHEIVLDDLAIFSSSKTVQLVKINFSVWRVYFLQFHFYIMVDNTNNEYPFNQFQNDQIIAFQET